MIRRACAWVAAPVALSIFSACWSYAVDAKDLEPIKPVSIPTVVAPLLPVEYTDAMEAANRRGIEVWDAVAACESGGRWDLNVGRFDGGIQFLPSTWRAAGGLKYAPFAYAATREEQIDIADKWLARTSWRQWPACSKRLGLRP
jgi:hypothetical protein